MATIYKYPIPTATEPFEVKIKGFQEVVHAGLDANNQPCLWAVVDPSMPEEAWTFLLVATGQEFDSTKWVHLKTFDMRGFIWHLVRPLQQWGVQPGASMDNEKPLTPSANTVRHMIGDLRKHLRSAAVLVDVLGDTLGKGSTDYMHARIKDVEDNIEDAMEEKGIVKDSVTLGYDDESH